MFVKIKLPHYRKFFYRNKEEKRDLPIYIQLPGCCGINAFLMSINPEKNFLFRTFLDDMYEKLSISFDLKEKNRAEFGWSFLLSYLILKSLQENVLNDFLRKKIPDRIDDYIALLKFELMKRERLDKYFYDSPSFNGFSIDRNMLKLNTYKWRKNIELHLLFLLFGGEFFPQEQQIYDGTGSLYFTLEDFKDNFECRQQKFNILKDHLMMRENGIPAILLNITSFHWVTINDIQGNEFNINDSGRRYVNSIKYFSEDHRFYLYSYEQKRAIILRKNIRNFLKQEMELESELS